MPSAETIEQAAARAVFAERLEALRRTLQIVHDSSTLDEYTRPGYSYDACFNDRGRLENLIRQVETAIAKFREARDYYHRIGA